MMFVGNFPDNICEHTLQWLDLGAHLCLRETCRLYRTEIPRHTRTLVLASSQSARRCLQTVFCDSRVTGVTANLSGQAVSDYSCARKGNVERALEAEGVFALLLKRYRPAEFRVNNMVSGAQFSEVLRALEENRFSARKCFRVLQLGLATGGPRPYQDPRSHQACMERLIRLLRGRGVAVGDQVQGGAAISWPRLRELRLSCGVVGGDLEGLAQCLGTNMPVLEVLVLEGHPFRAPSTCLTSLANALRSASAIPTHRPLLTTLCLRHFKLEGIEGLRALSSTLSVERFPCLTSLTLDNCRLNDAHLRVLAAALPKMSRLMKTISLCSNYALSADGVSALAEALNTRTVQTNNVSEGTISPNATQHGLDGHSMATPKSGMQPTSSAPAWSVSEARASTGTSGLCDGCSNDIAPSMLETLDLSYSCWLRRPQSERLSTGQRKAAAPLTSLLKALAGGSCPRLKTLGLAGCYFGDEEVEELAFALENGCHRLRQMDITGNLFTEVGVKRLMAALLSGKLSPHLRMRVCRGQEPSCEVLYAAMSREDISKAADDWTKYQDRLLQATVR